MMIAFIILIIIITISTVMAIIYLVFMAHSETVTYIVSSDSCWIQGPTLSPLQPSRWVAASPGSTWAWRCPDHRLTSGKRTPQLVNPLNLQSKEWICDREASVAVLTLPRPHALEVNSLSSHVGPQGWHAADRCWDRGGWQGTRAPRVNLFHRSHMTLSTFSVCCQTTEHRCPPALSVGLFITAGAVACLQTSRLTFTRCSDRPAARWHQGQTHIQRTQTLNCWLRAPQTANY